MTIPYVRAPYPAERPAIAIDEFNPTDWFDQKAFLKHDLVKEAQAFPTDHAAHALLQAFIEVVDEVCSVQLKGHERESWQGKRLFDALNRRCGGRLGDLVEALQNEPSATNTHPWPGITSYNLPKVVLPHLWTVLARELAKWNYGGDWNSSLRITARPGQHWNSATVYITEPRRFTPNKEGTIPPIAILDATADSDILERWGEGRPVRILKRPIDPPPNTQHFAVRQGKKYGKLGLVLNGDHRNRVIAECRYFLRELDPNGELRQAGKVGLITFEGCEQEMADALNITMHLHFWGARGSNTLETCEVLFVVGTPAMHPDDAFRLARGIYVDDPVPLVEAHSQDTHGQRSYEDARVQRLVDYLTDAELTQCVHRNRPIRYDGRTVVTLCADASHIEYLPVTRLYRSLPKLNDDGTVQTTSEERLAEAYAELCEQGCKVTGALLATKAGVRRQDAYAWFNKQVG